MDPKLVQAIVERIKAGSTKEDIMSEVISAGHSREAFEAAYSVAVSGLANGPETVMAAPAINPSFTVSTLFGDSIKLAKENIQVLGQALLTFLLFTFVTVLATIATYFLVMEISGSSFSAFFLSLAVGLLMSVITVVTSSSALLRAVLHRDEGASTFKSHMKWALGAFVAITLVSIYVSIITRVGYMFLIIPGLLLNIYLFFSSFVLIDGKATGIDSLIVSMKMVYGRFWEVVLRLLVLVLVLMGSVILFYTLAPTLAFLNPFFVPVAVMAGTIVLVAVWYWQLCYMVVLYEALKKSEPGKPLPVSEKSLKTTFQVVIGIAVALLAVASFLFGFTAVSSGYLQFDTSERFWENSEAPFDVELKMSLLESATAARKYYSDNNTYSGVCSTLFINEHATCEEREGSFALEVPLSKGYYCIDSMDGNEVSRRSSIKDAQCGKK